MVGHILRRERSKPSLPVGYVSQQSERNLTVDHSGDVDQGGGLGRRFVETTSLSILYKLKTAQKKKSSFYYYQFFDQCNPV